MTDLLMGVWMVILLIVVNLIFYLMPESWINNLQAFSLEHWYIGPITLFVGVVGMPLILIWKTARTSGVPFRIVAQSYWEYITAKNYAERRLSTLKLAITEKELEENK